jgi:hypothetical protein
MPPSFSLVPSGSHRHAIFSFVTVSAVMGVACLCLGMSGCIIIEDGDPPTDPWGDVSFDWSFEGITDCDAAGVDELDLVILQDDIVVDARDGVPCVGRGLSLLDIPAGVVVVSLDAYSRDDVLLYSGEFSIRVRGGQDNDAGLVELVSPRGPPAPDGGSVTFFWSFLYPNDAPTLDCPLAGVTDVEIHMQGPSAQDVSLRFDCTDEGAVVDELVEGSYSLSLLAHGTFQGAPLLLYSADVDVDIRANRQTDLGDIVLHRNPTAFGDVRVSWTWEAGTCAEENVDTLALSIRRLGFDVAEDFTSVDCDLGTVLRPTFVPGTYVVSLAATGSEGVFSGTTTVETSPQAVTVAQILLRPQ